MRRNVTLFYVLVLCVGIAGSVSGSQAQVPSPNTSPLSATTKNEPLGRQLSPEREAAKRARQADCQRQAREQRLRYIKRARFIRRCLRG